MRTTKSIIVSVFALTALLIAGATTGIAHADTTAATCTVKSVGTKNTAGNSNSRFILNSDSTVAATFTVTGTDCAVSVTLAVWQAPNADKGRPYTEQKLFNHTTGIFAEGTHTLSIALPNCFYQVDLVRGTSPTAADGSPVYDISVLMGSLHGGTQTCTPPPPPAVPPTLPKTGSGTNIFLLSGIVAFAGYGISLIRKARA